MYLYSKPTNLNSVVIARAYETALTDNSNTYVGIGVAASETQQQYLDTIERNNIAFRNMIGMKKLYSSDVNLVVPDVAWATGTTYDQFNSNEEMYLHDDIVELTGTVSYIGGGYSITGADLTTVFQNELSVGDIIEFNMPEYSSSTIRRQVVDIVDNYEITINTVITSTISESNSFGLEGGVSMYKVTANYPRYAKSFYVRNTFDQVFICIFNNGDTKSTVEPVLRPENFSMGKLIQDLNDGYVWRYLYTIPSGLKEKFFFTDKDAVTWMPVTTDTIVASTAVDGAIESLRVVNGGNGYNSNTACSNVDMISVTGDGSSALFFANVSQSSSIDSTTIYSILSANSGSGYSYANVTITDTTGISANLSALIGPPNGFGYDPAKDLGAKFLALSVEFSDTVGGAVPISTDAGIVSFRQISIVKDPLYSNGASISTAYVPMTSNVRINGTISVAVGDIANQTSGFSGTVVAFNTPYLLLNNVTGTFSENSGIAGGTGTSIATPSVKRSGDILYVDNIQSVSRDAQQAEQIKLVFKF